MHAPERPGSSQYHAPSSALTGQGRERGQGSWYGCSCGPSPPVVTLNPCRRVNVNTFPRRPWSPLQAAAGRRPRRWASAATVARETLSSRARDHTLRPSVLLRSQAPGARGRVGVHGLGPRTSTAPGCESTAPGCGRRALGRQSGAPSCEIRARSYESRARGYKGGVPGYESRAPGGEVRSPDREGRAAVFEGGAPGRERGAADCDRGAAACGKGTAGPQIDLGRSKRLNPDRYPVEAGPTVIDRLMCRSGDRVR